MTRTCAPTPNRFARTPSKLSVSLGYAFRWITADVRVDTGNLEEYGLDTTNGIIAEMWLGGEEPAVSFTVATTKSETVFPGSIEPRSHRITCWPRLATTQVPSPPKI